MPPPTPKERVLQRIEALPDSATFEEVQAAIRALASEDPAPDDAEAGRATPTDGVGADT